MTSINLLLIEDNPDDARIVTKILSRNNSSIGLTFQIHHSETMTAAYDELVNHTCQFVLSDLSLPDFDGFRDFSTLKVYLEDVPFLLMSGSDDQTLKLFFNKYGDLPFIHKDQLAPNTLTSRIKELMA